MKLNLEEMREIARTLPIGYYLGRKVPVTVEEHDDAYCDVVKGDIHIGIGLLQMAANHIDAKDAAAWNREKLLRCLLYHEIGHLILTPKWLKTHVAVMRPDGTGYGTRERTDILNIFEDERLESILSGYFMGVDFRAFVELVHKGERLPSDEVSEVFKAIRLRQCLPAVDAAVDDAVRDLAAMTAVTDPFRRETWMGRSFEQYEKYGYVVTELVKKILDGAKAKAQQQSQSSQPQSQSQSSQSQQSQQTGDGAPKDKPEQGESGPDKSDKDGGQGKPDKGDGKPEEKSDKDKTDGKQKNDGGKDGKDDKNEGKGGKQGGKPEKKEDDSDGGGDADGTDAEHDSDRDDESQRKSAKPFPSPGFAPDYLKKLADKVFATPTQEVENTLRKFAQRLAKRKGAQAAGRWSALHGRIDTRRDVMDKERIFRRTADAGDRLNTSVHLVLWVDSSSSFKKSEPILNQILTATYRAAEMSGGRLDVDVVKAYNRARVAQDNNWAIHADYGNDINVTYEVAWAATRKRDRRNIDVVVFDGSAVCLNTIAARDEVFRIVKKIWNHPDCHLIVDNGNYTWANELKRAHVTYMSTGYAEKLQAEVLKLLDRIL